MKKAGYQRHVFVCLNEREPNHPRGCCKQRGSDEIFRTLKEGAKKAGLKDDEVRINRAGCLEHCEYGPSVVIYPEAVWYHVPTVEDAEEILREHVVGGRVVDRLLMDHIM
ncbi:MAG: (2Fe-2S) ferredoxin domain-containing protein [Betaproteobacteria bacterium]